MLICRWCGYTGPGIKPTDACAACGASDWCPEEDYDSLAYPRSREMAAEAYGLMKDLDLGCDGQELSDASRHPGMGYERDREIREEGQ